MTQHSKLEETFNLDPIDDIISESVEEITEEPVVNPTVNHFIELDKINAALPLVHGLEASEQELDDLADYAIKAHQDLMDLAMNVEQRFIGEISGAASNMLSNAITARTNKLKKKLEMINLQIKKQIADAKTREARKDTPLTPANGTATVFDRNELLNDLIQRSKNVKNE